MEIITILFSILFFVFLFIVLSRWERVEEGDYKVIKLFGAIVMVLVSGRWKVARDGTISLRDPGEKPSLWEEIFGGLRWAGIVGFHETLHYDLRFLAYKVIDGEKKIVSYDLKGLDRGYCRADVYPFFLNNVSTKGEEGKVEEGKKEGEKVDRMPVDLWINVVFLVENPRKTHGRAPSNWVENVLAILDGMFREWISGTKTYDDLLALNRGTVDQIWNELKNEPAIKMIREDWGIKILHKEDIEELSKEDGKEKDGSEGAFGISIASVAQEKKYADAQASQKKEELLAKGSAAKTMGLLINMLAVSRGVKTEKIQEEIGTDKDLQKEFLELSKEVLFREMSLKNGALLDLRTKGAEGFEKMALNLLGMFKMIGSKGPVKAPSEDEEEEDSKEEKKEDKKENKVEDNADTDKSVDASAKDSSPETTLTKEDVKEGGKIWEEHYKGMKDKK